MIDTELVRADQLVKGDRLGHLQSDFITSVTNHPKITVITLHTPHGPAHSEIPQDQLIRIMKR